MVVKERPDGTKKYRIIWDLRQNRVNLLVDQGERVVLPRLWEAIGDALDLSAACEHGETVTWVALDICDAFNNIPVRHNEIRFTCCSLQGRYYAFTRLVFGSASSPTVWGRFGAWLGRSLASLF